MTAIKQPDIFLHDILDSIELIEKRVKNITQDRFMQDIDLQDMVVRRLEIIGEAVRNLPKEFRGKHADIDWQSPAETRSVLIHGYAYIDFNIVWDTITNDLPPFKKRVKKLLEELES